MKSTKSTAFSRILSGNAKTGDRTGSDFVTFPIRHWNMRQYILCTAYELYEKLEDSNVSYHVTMENVIDAIEKQILNGELRPHPEPAPRVVLIMEDGIVTASYTNTPFIQAEVIKLDKEYDSAEEREAVYGALEHDPELTECECHITRPGREKEAA